MWEFPNIVNIEVFRGACPCCCRHCPVGRTHFEERPLKFGNKGLKLSLLHKISDEMTLHPSSLLRFHSVGEPLLWNDLEQALKITKNKSVKTWLFTCGITENFSLLRTICQNASIIEVSVNSIDPDDYRRTKGIDAYNRVFENLKFMHDFIKSHGLNTRLLASRVETGSERDGDFVEYWNNVSGLVDEAFVRSYHTYNGLLFDKVEQQYTKQIPPCLVFWARFNLSIDGNAIVCFNELFKEDQNPSVVLGNLNNDSIANIWQGGKLNAIRKAQLNKNYSGPSFLGQLPCKHCTSCQPLRGHRKTSEHQIEKRSIGKSDD